MKKLLLLIFAVAILFTTASAEKTARESFVSGDYSYALLEDGTAEITEYLGNSPKVSIPSKLDKIPVTSIGEKAFFERKFLTSVTIPGTVTTIRARRLSGLHQAEGSQHSFQCHIYRRDEFHALQRSVNRHCAEQSLRREISGRDRPVPQILLILSGCSDQAPI